ncbi:MAG: cytochrome P450 [Acidimicrobiales bacterium]|nr:cytochrome P450 [Acidimicrobiales bacterium]
MWSPYIDFGSGDFYLDARSAYQHLRDNAPVYLDEQHSGLWGVARYDDVIAVERDPVTFSSAGGSRPDTGPLPWMIDMDGAAHSKRRRLVSHGFTPARVRATQPHLRAICDELIDRVCEAGACDFVADIAAPLPMIVIGDMLGVPASDRAQLLDWSRGMLASLSGDAAGYERAAQSFGAYVEYAQAVVADRRSHPRDDLFSVLVHAEVGGERLSDDEIVFESLLLLIGGDETTRHVAAGGLEQLLLHPEQMRELRVDPSRLPSAVEEMLRWVSPIKNMARTVTTDTVLGGVAIPAGAKLVVLYESANFDHRQFVTPDQFDVTRQPNDHVAFGFGPHFCLGAALARMELAVLFDRLLARLPDLHRPVASNLARTLAGIERMPLTFSPSAPRTE